MAFGIAVLGLDHWYTAFGILDICTASTTAPLISVYEPDPARRAEAAAAYPNAFVTNDAAAALAQPGVALAAVCAKTGDAVGLCKQALFAGKHVISVKPFARSEQEAEELLAAAITSGQFFGSFEGMQRLHPRVEKLRQLIQDGAIGEVVHFSQVGHGALPSPWRGEPSGGPSWWLDPNQVPGGAWIDHAIYAVDLARFVLKGEVDNEKTSGSLSRILHKDLDIEDYGATLMTLHSEGKPPVTLSIIDTWSAEPGVGYGEYRFLGTQGTITAEGYEAWSVKTKDGTTRHIIESGPFFPMERLALLLEKGEKPPFGADDALANLMACLTVYRNIPIS